MLLITTLLTGTALTIGARALFRRRKQKQALPRNPAQTPASHTNTSDIVPINDQTDIDLTEKSVNRYLTVSVLSLGFAIAGITVYAPLALVGLAGFLYTTASFYQDAYRAITKERRLTIAVVDAVMFTGVIIIGSVIAGTLMSVLVWSSKKLLIKTEDRSRKSLVNVFGKQPRSAWLLEQGIEIEIPFEQLRAGDTIVVNTGEMIPADGVITSGSASVNQHTLTGESQPVEKTLGDSVFATTVLLSGKIHIQVEKAGTESVAAQIGETLLRTADFRETTRAHWVERVDKMAPLTLSAGTVALPVLGLKSAISLLCSFHFGYSMRVIAPAAMLNFLNLASQHGILVKDGRSLEWLNQVDTVVFDKTGTLTLEQPQLGRLYTVNQYSEDELLTYAAAAEYKQTHPIAKAIRLAAKERELELPSIDSARYEMGYGVKVCIEEKTVHVGSTRFMLIEGITVPDQLDHIQQYCHDHGHSLVMIAVDGQLEGALELHTVIRPEAKYIINELQRRNKAIYIISGDHEKPTQQLAQTLGINHYFAETLPEQKADLVKQLQAEDKFVCFIGDGINDSIALKQANTSISMRGATSVATDTAQIVLMDGSLKQLVQLFDLAKNYNRNVDHSFLITLIPTTTAIGGILFLKFALLALLFATLLALPLGSLILHCLYCSTRSVNKA